MGETWEDEGDKRAGGMLVQGVVCVVMGALVLGFGAKDVFSQSDGLSALTGAWTAGGAGISTVAVSLLEVACYCGGGVLVFGLLGVVAQLRNSRVLAIVALIFVTVLSLMQIVGAVLFSQLVDTSFSILEPTTTDPTVVLDAEQGALLNTAHAVFNDCCVDQFSALPALAADADKFQVAIDECGAPVAPLPDIISSFSLTLDLLQSCYDNTLYDAILSFIEINNKCVDFEQVIVPVGDELEIPTLGVSIAGLLRTEGLLDDDETITDFRMVGWPGKVDPDGEEGFNCGLMYAKGVAWIQNIFLENVGKNVTLVLYAAASIQLLSVILVAVFWCMGTGGGDEEWMDYDRKLGPTTTDHIEV